MPRINTAASIRTSEVTEKDTTYDLNSSFKADHKETIYEYNSQNNLVLWSQLCGKASSGTTIDGLSGGDYAEFASDRSLNGNDNKMYSVPGMLMRRLTQTNAPYIFSFLDANSA